MLQQACQLPSGPSSLSEPAAPAGRGRASTGTSYVTLDAWRGLAALWVVGFHASQLAIREHPALRSTPVYVVGLIGFLGVQIFFVISGYCIANAAASTLRSGRKPVSFVRARIKRIFPPMWLSLPLFVAFELVGHALVSRHVWNANLGQPGELYREGITFWVGNLSLSHFVLHVGFISGVCWTLCYEMAFYLIVALCLVFGGRIGREPGMLNMCHALTAVCLLLLIFEPDRMRYPLDMWPQFGMGVLVYDLTAHPTAVITWLAAAMNTALTIVFVVARNASVGMQQPARLTFIVALVFAGALVVLRGHDRRLSATPLLQPLIRLGGFSYSLYLTHIWTIGVVTQSFKLIHAQDATHLRFVAGMTISIVGAWIFFCFAERPFLSARRRPREESGSVASPALVLAVSR